MYYQNICYVVCLRITDVPMVLRISEGVGPSAEGRTCGNHGTRRGRGKKGLLGRSFW